MSQHWKKWEERFAEVVSYQFNSYPFKIKEEGKVKEDKKKVKDKKGEEKEVIVEEEVKTETEITIGKCTFKVKKIEEIWTRFDFQEEKLIFKIFHNREKTELAVPVCNFADILSEGNWLYGLTTVMRGS